MSTAIYASPDECLRPILWQELCRIDGQMGTPWILVGDFNYIKSLAETTSLSSYTMRRFCQFANWINEMQLIDLSYISAPFAWARGRDSRTRIYS